MGDVNGDCVFDIVDVLAFHQDGCASESALDFNSDGTCNGDDVMFLLRANFRIVQFVREIFAVPVNETFCYLNISVSLSGRGDQGVGGHTSLLLGLFHGDADFQTEFDGTTIFRNFGEELQFSVNTARETTNGGFVAALRQSPGRHEAVLNTPISNVDIGLILIQARVDGYGTLLSASRAEVMTGSPQLPLRFPESLTGTVEHPLGLDIPVNLNLGFSALYTFDQIFSSPDCINDNRPVFFPQRLVVEIYENQEPSTFVATLLANDSDLGPNAEIAYSLHNPNSSILSTFSINATSGEVTLIGPLNREEITSYFILVRAIDDATLPRRRLEGFGELNVVVLDVNDETPQFTEDPYVSDVREDVESGFEVLTIRATDGDLGENSSLTYTFPADYTDFGINSTTGDIFVLDELDFERQIMYNLTVLATDDGVEPLTGTSTVIIVITPINDNQPDCGPTERLAILPEDMIPNIVFLVVNASDADDGDVLTFTLDGTSREFDIIPEGIDRAGLVTMVDVDFDRFRTPSYNVTVIATDNGGQSCSLAVTIIVGEPSQFDFEVAGAGYFAGPVLPLEGRSGYSRDITFFSNSLTSGFVTASLEDITGDARYTRSPMPVALVSGVLRENIVWYDRPIISIVAQARDLSFRAVSTNLTAIVATPGGVDSILASNCVADERPHSGLCVFDVQVPLSWFSSYTSLDVSLTSQDMDAAVDVGSVELRPPVPVDITGTQNITLELPLHNLYSSSPFTIWVGAPPELGMTAFALSLILGSGVEVSLSDMLTNDDKWYCNVSGINIIRVDLFCYRTYPGVSSLSPLTGMDRFFGIQGRIASDFTGEFGPSTIRAVAGTMVSASVFSNSSFNPATLYDRDGLGSPEVAMLSFVRREVVGVFAATPHPEMVHTVPLNGEPVSLPVAAYVVYNQPQSSFGDVVAPEDILCTSDTGIVEQAGSSCNFSLTADFQQCDLVYAINVTHTPTTMSSVVPFKVWCFSDAMVAVNDPVLNPVSNWLDDGCNFPVFQRSRVTIWGQFQSGDETSQYVDLTDDLIGSLVPMNSTVVDIVEATRSVRGLSPGSTTLNLTLGSFVTTRDIEVSDNLVELYDITAEVASALEVTVVPGIYMTSSTIRASAVIADTFDPVAGTSGSLRAYAYFTDGARHSIPAEELRVVSRDENIVSTSMTSSLTAVMEGETDVAVEWRPTSCPVEPLGQTTHAIRVAAPVPIRLDVSVTESSISGDTRDATVTNLPTSSGLIVTVYYSNGTSRALTSTQETGLVIDTPSSLVLDTADFSVRAAADTNATVAGIAVSYTAGSETIMESVSLAIISIVSIEVRVQDYPVPDTILSTEITLERLGPSLYQQAQIVSTALLSNGSFATVSATYSPSRPLFVDITEGGVVTPVTPAGSGTVEVTAGNFPPFTLSISVQNLMLDVQEVRNLHLVDLTPTTRQVTADVTFSDNSIINDVIGYRDAALSDLLQFSIVPMDVASVNPSTWVLNISSSHYDFVTIEARSTGPLASIQFPANLGVPRGSLDLGEPMGIPQPPVTPSESFSVDIRANIANLTISALDLYVFYDPTVFDVAYADSSLPGFSSVRTNSPSGEIQLTYISDGYISQTEPIFLRVNFSVLASARSGVASVETLLRTLVDNSLTPTPVGNQGSRASLEVLVTGGSSSPPTAGQRNGTVPEIPGTLGGRDVNQDGRFDVLDALYVFQALGGIRTIDDPTGDFRRTVANIVFLTRAAAGLVPFLDSVTVEPVSADNDCLLDVTAQITFPPNGPHPDRTAVYFVLSHPDGGDLIGMSVVGDAMSSQNIDNTSFVFTASPPAAVSGSTLDYTLTLFTPIDTLVSNIGVTVVVWSWDERNISSPERVTVFQLDPHFIASGVPAIPQLPSLALSRLQRAITVGDEDGFAPYTVFNNNQRSDYCRFDNSSETRQVLENFPVNGTIFTIMASDPIFPSTGEVYTSRNSFPFEVTRSGDVRLVRELDFEVQVEYTFEVSVFSELGGYVIGNITVNINVSDVNDFAPEFQGTENYTATVLEDADEGVAVFDGISALDRDGGLNGVFEYTIDEDSDPFDQFSIDPTTGTVSVNSILDRENISDYRLTIYATDMGTSPLTGTAVLNIAIGDVNDNPPMFMPSDNYIITIPENVYNGEPILYPDQINVTDADAGINALVSISSPSLDPPAPIRILQDGGIEVVAQLDRESVEAYQFSLTATDSGLIPLSSTATLIVIVGDVNDNLPIFEPGTPLMFIVEEDKIVGTVVYDFNATDDDSALNSVVTYSIAESVNAFAIDSLSGVLTVNESLNIDDVERYELTIRATDSDPVNPGTTEMLVMLNIIEGQIITFSAGENGFLFGERLRVSNALYTQEVGALFGENINEPVLVSGGINHAISSEVDRAELPNLGGMPTSMTIKSSILQQNVPHSLRTVTVFLQAFDSRETIARPATISVRVVPSTQLRNLGREAFVEDSCTTSAELGVCIVKLRLPDEWFIRATTNTETDIVTVWSRVAGDGNINSFVVGTLVVEHSPVFGDNVAVNNIALIGPSHPIYAGQNFSMEVYVVPPQVLLYTFVEFDVSGAPVEDIGFDSDVWDCTLSQGGAAVRCVLDSPPQAATRLLKLADLIFTAPNEVTSGEIEIENIFLGTMSLISFVLEREYFVTNDAPEYFFTVAQQPDIVNTALLNGAAVSKSIRYFALNSSVATRSEGMAMEISSPASLGARCTPDSDVILLSDDCTEVSVMEGLAVSSTGYADITVTIPSLRPVHSTANRVRVHIWTPTDFQLSSSTNRLSRVSNWKDLNSCGGSDRFQPVRISATASFSSGTESFVGGVYPLIASNLDLAGSGVLNEERGIFQPSQDGEQVILFTGPISQGRGIISLNISGSSIRIMKIDPILASLRLDPTGVPAASTLGETGVSLEILSGLFFSEERSEVTVSVILENGHRFVITDPAEIQLQTSNDSILMVDDNFVVARGVGVAELNVMWIVCDMILGSSTIEITVEFSDHRPIFASNPQTAEIAEGSPLGTPVVTVFANDLDFTNSTDLSRRDTEYRFADESSTHDGLFVLDKTTGVITLNGPLDRETRDSYIIQIEATDRAQRLLEQQRQAPPDDDTSLTPGSGSGSGSGDILMPVGPTATLPPPSPSSLRIDRLMVTVEVTDINDNSPVCPRLPPMQLDRGVEVGTMVTTLEVTDADIGSNGDIQFVRVRGEFAPQFLEVHPSNGQIITSNELNSFVASRSLLPLIDVMDRGTPPNPQTCEFTIMLFSRDDTVSTIVIVNTGTLNINIFEDVLGDLLGLDIDVTNSERTNRTFFTVDFTGRDGQELVTADDLRDRVELILEDPRLVDAGLTIVQVSSNSPVTTPPPPVPTRPIPTWAVAVIVVLNSVIIIAVLLIVLGITWRRYKRTNKKENQRDLNKKKGLLMNIDDVEMESVDVGELVETGGIVDPERGALVYRKTTQVETVEPGMDSDFTTKKIKTVTSESSWLGQAKEAEKAGALPIGQPTEVKPWHDEEVESNPLYSATEYTSDFNNPLYSRQSAALEDGEGSPPPIGREDEIPLVPMGKSGGGGVSAGDEEYTSMEKVDTLF